jgi:hypothetical protein
MTQACVCRNQVHEVSGTHPPPGQVLPAAQECRADGWYICSALTHLLEHMTMTFIADIPQVSRVGKRMSKKFK